MNISFKNRRQNVCFVTQQSGLSGANRASLRILNAISLADSNSFNLLVFPPPGDPQVTDQEIGFLKRRLVGSLAKLASQAVRIPLRAIYGFGHRSPTDYGVVSSGLGRTLSESSPRLTHLHWLGDGDLSLREIGQLPCPVVWTMHDMWTFLGAERFTMTDSYVDGYRTNHGEPRGRQFVNRVFFSLKKKLWKQPITLVAPSSWMAERAKLSPITRDWPIHVIPNALDTEFWTPGDSKQSRASLGLPEDKWVILFGAVDPMGDHNKGADLLESALNHLRGQLSPDEAEKFHIAVFGSAKRKTNNGGFPVTFLGQLSDDGMRDAYRSADVVIVPSRLENLPQVATEAE